MRYREFKLVEADQHNPAWDKRSVRSVIDLNILHQHEYFANAMRPNDGLLILGLVGDPKLKKLQSELRWIADKMSSADPNNLDSRVQNVATEPQQPGDNVLGTFTPWTGEIKGIVQDLNDEYQRYSDNTTLQHEALHRAFAIIAATPKLMAVMPAELKNNWSKGIGNPTFDTYDPARTDNIQYSPEHSMIYSVTDPNGTTSAGGYRFNRGLYENYSWVKKFFDQLSPEFNDRYVDLTNDEQPITDLDEQMLFYWQNLYRQCNESVRGALSVKGLLYSPRPKLRPGSDATTPEPEPTTPPGNNRTFQEIEFTVEMLQGIDWTSESYGTVYEQLRPAIQDHFRALGYSPVDRAVTNNIQQLTQAIIDGNTANITALLNTIGSTPENG